MIRASAPCSKLELVVELKIFQLIRNMAAGSILFHAADTDQMADRFGQTARVDKAVVGVADRWQVHIGE